MNHLLKEVETYLHEHIPLTKAMEVKLKSLDETSLTLVAPLGPNINHRETVFGGSASALGILAAWSSIHVRMKERKEIQPRIVIQRNSMEYTKPVISEFEATCTITDSKAWDRFMRSLEKKGVGRIRLEAVLKCEEEEVGYFEGSFVTFDMNRGL